MHLSFLQRICHLLFLTCLDQAPPDVCWGRHSRGTSPGLSQIYVQFYLKSLANMASTKFRQSEPDPERATCNEPHCSIRFGFADHVPPCWHADPKGLALTWNGGSFWGLGSEFRVFLQSFFTHRNAGRFFWRTIDALQTSCEAVRGIISRRYIQLAQQRGSRVLSHSRLVSISPW